MVNTHAFTAGGEAGGGQFSPWLGPRCPAVWPKTKTKKRTKAKKMNLALKGQVQSRPKGRLEEGYLGPLSCSGAA